MKIETISVGALQANCFVVWGEEQQAIVIDPGADAQLILSTLDSHNLTVALYVLTHGHVDHISALAELCEERNAPTAMHAADHEWAFEESNRLPPIHSSPRRPSSEIRHLEDGQECEDAGLKYQVLHTPGHSPGSICLHFPDANCVFTGDTLFEGSVGRTDFPGGDSETLMRSLKRLLILPDDTVIYPGHGPATDLAIEKRTNYFLQ
jgi:glyoxylase-like metal-dependent hydrolase (beta-lactamase superfamily II)